MYTDLLIDDDGPVRVLTLNRPHALNALDTRLGAALGDAIQAADADPSVACLILTGSGPRAFSAGGDLKEIAGGDRDGANGARAITRALRTRPAKPLIAAVNGLAYGGGMELMLACDLVVASTQARFALSEVTLGVLPAGGGLTRLPQIVGNRRALQLVLTGTPIDAATGLDWGLINEVVPADEVRPAALRLAHRIARNAPLAVAVSKRTLLAAQWLSEPQAWELNDAAFEEVRYSHDAQEGPRAFAGKRRPVWESR
jgi:crotonobetainyl-CoA hydratase